ncbi:CopG family transcriptional regulator [Spirochaetota bacterium]
MKRKIKYTDAPKDIAESLKYYKKVKDFLPPPELLIRKEPTQKVTLSLTEKSIKFFKKVSKKNHIPYQQLIRKVIDQYAKLFT